MIGPVIRFLLSGQCQFTIIIPNVFLRRFWWPLVNGRATDKIRLGSKTQTGILLYTRLFRRALNPDPFLGISGLFVYNIFFGWSIFSYLPFL